MALSQNEVVPKHFLCLDYPDWPLLERAPVLSRDC